MVIGDLYGDRRFMQWEIYVVIVMIGDLLA